MGGEELPALKELFLLEENYPKVICEPSGEKKSNHTKKIKISLKKFWHKLKQCAYGATYYDDKCDKGNRIFTHDVCVNT